MKLQVSDLKAVIAMFNSASKDQTRYNICGVYCEINAPFLTLVATDGRQLARRQITVDPDTAKALDKYSFTDCKALKAFVKDVCRISEIDLGCEAKGINMWLSSPLSNSRIALEKREYPDYKMLLKDDSTCVAVVALNPELLLSVTKALDGEASCARIHFRGPKNAMVIKVGDSEGLLMPMQHDDCKRECGDKAVDVRDDLIQEQRTQIACLRKSLAASSEKITELSAAVAGYQQRIGSVQS